MFLLEGKNVSDNGSLDLWLEWLIGRFSCPSCSSAIPARQLFKLGQTKCRSCGRSFRIDDKLLERLLDRLARQQLCSNCGTPNPIKHNFCAACGDRLERDQTRLY